MKLIAAYLLAVLGGNSNPSAGDIKYILESAMPKGSKGFIAWPAPEETSATNVETEGEEALARRACERWKTGERSAACGRGNRCSWKTSERPTAVTRTEERLPVPDRRNYRIGSTDLWAKDCRTKKTRASEEDPLINFGIELKRAIIFGAVGADADGKRIEYLLSEVKGKDITELIASGREKFASVPSGGGAIAATAPAGGGGGVAIVAAAAAEPKKEEKVEEKEESDDKKSAAANRRRFQNTAFYQNSGASQPHRSLTAEPNATLDSEEVRTWASVCSISKATRSQSLRFRLRSFGSAFWRSLKEVFSGGGAPFVSCPNREVRGRIVCAQIGVRSPFCAKSGSEVLEGRHYYDNVNSKYYAEAGDFVHLSNSWFLTG
ncbi:60S acidic ribosomal protein P2-4 [Platanthera guangdongensis]|uniref:60S acidic ribosomal protein P2-4 n=1 Tax=Platanthera guangdongensis TaxID=2320717 RepID=A0ABR2M3R8_9ASPA